MKLTAKLRLFWEEKAPEVVGAVGCGIYVDVWVDVNVEQVETRHGILIEYIEDEEPTDEEFEILGYYYDAKGNLPTGIYAVGTYGLPDKVRLLDTEWEVEDGDGQP